HPATRAHNLYSTQRVVPSASRFPMRVKKARLARAHHQATARVNGAPRLVRRRSIRRGDRHGESSHTPVATLHCLANTSLGPHPVATPLECRPVHASVGEA